MVEVIERGDIAFFYRPRVRSLRSRSGAAGVQRFFVILNPARGAARRLRIGRKRMPPLEGQRFWAIVERVGSLDRALADQLEAERYATKTRGDRYQPAALPVAQGSYAFVRHDDHIHLVYRVEHAEDPADLPEEVRVPAAASYVVLFERVPPGRARWTSQGSPSRLDHEGAEIVLVGVDDQPERTLGIDLLGSDGPGPAGA